MASRNHFDIDNQRRKLTDYVKFSRCVKNSISLIFGTSNVRYDKYLQIKYFNVHSITGNT